MSSAGRAASSSGCVARPRGHETGLIGYAESIQHSSPTGSSVMETAEHREPYESRGSRTDLGAPGGESPPATRQEEPFSRRRSSGRCGFRFPAIRASESESGTATDAHDRPVAPSTLVLPSAQISRGPLRLPQCCFRFVESRRFSRLEGVSSAFRYHIPFQRIACFLSDLPSRHAGFHKRLKQ